MKAVLGIILAGSLLAGCATLCPQEKKYTLAEQQAFLNALPRTPEPIVGAMRDYGDLRREVRACRGE